jgi:hypothetical protein
MKSVTSLLILNVQTIQERGAYGPFEFVLFICVTAAKLVIRCSLKDFSSEPFFQDHPDKNGIGDIAALTHAK